MVLDCLGNFIGLTDKTCACYPTNTAGEINVSESTSGIFQTDFINLKIAGISDCDTASNMWGKMNKALTHGAHETIQDLTMRLRKPFRTASGFHGTIGNKTPKTFTGSIGAFHGVRLKANRVSGYFATIKSVFVRSNASETGRKVYVVDTYGNILYTSAVFDLTNSDWKEVEIDQRFSLNDDIDPSVEQYLYILTDTEDLTTGNDAGCNSCNSGSYGRYFKIDGAHVSALADVEASTLNSNGHGLYFKAEAGCDLVGSICEFFTDDDITNLAIAVGAKSANILSDWIAQENLIDTYTVLGSEALGENAAMNDEKYEEAMNNLVGKGHYPSCFICNTGTRVGHIRV